MLASLGRLHVLISESHSDGQLGLVLAAVWTSTLDISQVNLDAGDTYQQQQRPQLEDRGLHPGLFPQKAP